MRKNRVIEHNRCYHLVDRPMRPSALREAVGIRSLHFSRYYLKPLMEKKIWCQTPHYPRFYWASRGLTPNFTVYV